MADTIGMIAGRGIYPKTFIDAARSKAKDSRLILAAIKGETDESLVNEVDEIAWFRVGQLGKLIKFFKLHDVAQAVMVGQVTPRNLFELRPDVRTMMLLARLKEKNAETLFGGIAQELEKDEIHLLPATTYLEDCLPSEGLVFGPPLKKEAMNDAQYGFKMAKETSRLDIGQTVIVREGTVLAVEAFEGTNACIYRGGELGQGKNITLAKVSKPNQDFRFDVPVIGPDTVKNCVTAGIKVIVIESEKTLMLNMLEIETLCTQHRVSIVSLKS